MYILPKTVEIKEAIRLLNESKLKRMTVPIEKNETHDA
jgi:hypothetical protein